MWVVDTIDTLQIDGKDPHIIKTPIDKEIPFFMHTVYCICRYEYKELKYLDRE